MTMINNPQGSGTTRSDKDKTSDDNDTSLLGEYFDETKIKHGRPLPPRNLQSPAKAAAMSDDARDLDLLTSTLFVEEGIDNWREKRKLAYAKRGFTRSRKPFDEFVAKTKKRGFTFSRLQAAKKAFKSYISSDAMCMVYNGFLDTGGTENASFMDELKNLRDIQQPWNVQFFGHYGGGKSQVSRANDHAYIHEIGKNPRYVMDCYDPSRRYMEVVLFPEFPHEFTKDEDKDHPAKWSKDFINIYYGFALDQARHIIQNLMCSREICHLDEILTMHDKGSRVEVDDLNNTIKSSNRAMDLNMNSTTPDPAEIAQVDFYYRVLAWNRTEKTTLVLRCYTEDKSAQATGLNLVYDAILVFSVNEPEALTKFVNDASLEIKTAIKSRGGHTKARNADIKTIANELVTSYDELDDEEDQEYYKSTKAAFREFAELNEEISAKAGRNLDLVCNRAFWKLFKHKAPGTNGGSQDPAEQPELVLEGPSDEEIMASEVATITGQGLVDDPRIPYLQQGLNVTLEAIHDLEAGDKTNEDLETISMRRNEKARREFIEARYIPTINFGDEEPRNQEMVATPTKSVQQGDKFVVDIMKLLEARFPNQEQLNIYKRSLELAPTAKNKATIAVEFGKTDRGIDFIIERVDGWLADEIGHEYEPWLAGKKRKELGEQVKDIICEGTKGPNFPDIVIEYKNGDIDVISVKCEYTRRKTTSKPAGEFAQETTKATEFARSRATSKIRCFIHYYDRVLDESIEREIDYKNPPGVRINRKDGHLAMKLIVS